MVRASRRKTWADMDHDRELLREEIVRRGTAEERGPIAEFLAKKRAEQAQRTWESYRTAMDRFHAFLGEDATVGDVDERAVHRFITHLRSAGFSENGVATYINRLKVFTAWMRKKGWTDRDRFEDVKRPKFVRPRFDTLTVEQKQAMLGSFNPQTFLGARNLAILAVFMDTGVRREELVHLKAERVHLAEGYIEVYSEKTDEWRIIPLSDEAIEVCQNYLERRARFFDAPIRHRARPDDVNYRRKSQRHLTADTFFCTWKGGAMKENGVGLVIRRLRGRLKAAGMKMPIHPHLFRHNFLTEKALDGENPSMVRRWAGHKTHAMTDYYFGIAESKLAALKPKKSTLAGVTIRTTKRQGGRRPSGAAAPPRRTNGS